MMKMVLALMLIAVAVSLAGCSDAKYLECAMRDGTSNPCH